MARLVIAVHACLLHLWLKSLIAFFCEAHVLAKGSRTSDHIQTQDPEQSLGSQHILRLAWSMAKAVSHEPRT